MCCAPAPDRLIKRSNIRAERYGVEDKQTAWSKLVDCKQSLLPSCLSPKRAAKDLSIGSALQSSSSASACTRTLCVLFQGMVQALL